MAATQPTTKGRGPPTAVKYYLVAFNVVSALGWAFVLVGIVNHLFFASPSATERKTAVSAFSRIVASIPYIKDAAPLSARVHSRIPPALLPYYNRAASTYAIVGPETALIQTLAVLEVVHAALGWVKSPVVTTAMQVASRLFLVWGVVEQFEVARNNPIFASMAFAWSLTETVRYPFYAFSLLGLDPPYPLLWMRYSTFYVLYPLGAGSEAALIYSTLPHSSPFPSWASWLQGMWKPQDYVRGALLLIWPPALYVLYTYMIKQRRKALGAGKGRLLSEKKAQ